MQLETAADEATLVMDGLRRLVHGVRVGSHLVEHDLGVSGAQLFVLRELAAEPGASIRRLSERTLTDPSSVSAVVARLVERGLVTQRRAEEDARRSVLEVSRKGASLLSRAPEPFQARLITSLRTLPRARLRQFGSVLAEIVRALDLDAGAAPLFFETSPRGKARSRRVKP
jgi:MarR family transcriptional regulator, lower aerobic nicotinate degradation pathway regulator